MPVMIWRGRNAFWPSLTAYLLIKGGRYEEAAGSLIHPCVSAEAAEGGTWLMVAGMLESLFHRHDAAEAAYRRAIAILPESAVARDRLESLKTFWR